MVSKSDSQPSFLQGELERATGHQLAIRRVPLSALALDPANARLHPEQNMDAIKASLSHFGQVEPLVVLKSTGRIIGGNGRLVAMKALGWTECDIVEIDVSDLDATALGIALNRSAELATWDDAALAQILSTLRNEDSLAGVGFSSDEIDELLAGQEGVGAIVDDQGPEEPPLNPIARTGDLWILGDHRLLCGEGSDVVNRKLPPEAFDVYVSMGLARSYQAVARHFQVSQRTVTRQAAREGWRTRLQAAEAAARARLCEQHVAGVTSKHAAGLPDPLQGIDVPWLARLFESVTPTIDEWFELLELSVSLHKVLLFGSTRADRSRQARLQKRLYELLMDLKGRAASRAALNGEAA